jgi:uncharacterized protein (TIGR02611 family)
MSPGVEDRSRSGAGAEPAMAAPSGATDTAEQQRHQGSAVEHGEHQGHHHHVLLEAEEDRWAWRRKIRADPRKLVLYRTLIGFIGLVLICLGFVSGPLPGPGGIPLILAGLAVWSTEFDWANNLMHWFKAKLHGYRTWAPHLKVAFWVVFFGCCLLIGYGYLLLLGAPGWLPDSLLQAINTLPGVN